jgi:hypothetical protein
MLIETMVQEVVSPGSTGIPGDELSDGDLEHVVGGLVRAWSAGMTEDLPVGHPGPLPRLELP